MEKSRNLTNENFIKVLQLEYLSHKLRAIIYDKIEFKKMSNDIADKKKEKILNLAKRFTLSTIFDSDIAFETFWKHEFIQEYGLPKFQYLPTTEKSVKYWDRYHLLSKGQIIVWNNVEYKIQTNDPNEETVMVNKNGLSSIVPYIYFKIKKLSTISIDDLK